MVRPEADIVRALGLLDLGAAHHGGLPLRKQILLGVVNNPMCIRALSTGI
jgi:hypothetical protein